MDPAPQRNSPPESTQSGLLQKARASSPAGHDRLPSWVPDWFPDRAPGSPTEMGGNLDVVPLSSRSSESILFSLGRGRSFARRAKDRRPLSKCASVNYHDTVGLLTLDRFRVLDGLNAERIAGGTACRSQTPAGTVGAAFRSCGDTKGSTVDIHTKEHYTNHVGRLH